MKKYTLALCMGLLLSICLGSFARSTYAGSTGVGYCVPFYGNQTCESHGDRYRNLGGSDSGTHAYIAGTGYMYPPPGAVYATVGVQTAIGTHEDTYVGNAGIVEMGEEERAGAYQDVCGVGAATFAFFVYRVSGDVGFHCPYTENISPFGSGGKFDVVYQDGAWHANQNATEVGTVSSLGFTSGWSVAGDTVFEEPGVSGPDEAITFGPKGYAGWQFTTNNGSTYQNVVTSNVDQNNDTDGDGDGDWSLGGSPSPFNINWTGY